MKFIRSKYFKYIIVILIFGIWLSFFDDYSWSKRRELNKQLSTLQQESQKTKKKISEHEVENEKVAGDLDAMEAVGRDSYYMKRAEEDVFIFLKENENGELIPLE